MSPLMTIVGNIEAAAASLACVLFALLGWRLTGARWTLVMALGFGGFFVVRIGIITGWYPLDEYSRFITAQLYWLPALSLAWMWWGLRNYYRRNGNGGAAAQRTTEAARAAALPAHESRKAAVDANASTRTSRK